MNRYLDDVRALWLGLVLSLLTLLLGFGLGIAFGAGDKDLRAALNEAALGAVERAPEGPAAEVRVDRAWTFLRRAHLHANGMATTGIVLIALTPLLGVRRPFQQMIAGSLGAGSAGYAMFLIASALRTPSIGDASAVKESLRWLAMPAAGVYVLATLAFTGLVCRWAWQPRHRRPLRAERAATVREPVLVRR
jgi:hypothetical protein